MPDTAVAESPAGTDIGSLITPPKDVVEGLTSIARDKSAATDKVTSDIDRQLNADQFRATKAYEATSVGPDQLKPWDAEQKSKEFHHDPLEAFGSLGSVFGIVASAFTHAPMENALNASAAAMNAVKAGDDQGYERAHQAWKENMALVEKRHEMMRESYQDAVTLMKTNMAAGEAKLQTLAARYGDKKTLFLLENGMSEEVFKLMESRNKQIKGAVEASDAVTRKTMETRALDAAWKEIDQTYQNPYAKAAKALAEFNRIKGVRETPVQEALGVYMQEKLQKHQPPDIEEMEKIVEKMTPRYRGSGSDAMIIDTENQRRKEAGEPPLSGAEIADLLARSKGKTGGAGNSSLTVQRQNAKAADDYANQLRKDHPDMPEDEVQQKRAEKYAQLSAAASAPSGNKIDALKSRGKQIEYSVSAIDKIETLLKKHNALTGLGGKVTRPAETIASIFGSNEVDRHEFESLVSEVKEWAPRILTDSQGRPLSAEAGNIDKIIRGLNLGDTTKITAERLYQLKKLYQQMGADTLQRARVAPAGTSATPAETPGNSGPAPWQRDPIKDKRSDINATDAAA